MDREEENEVSLLDLLVVVAENIKLLLLGPLVVGVLILGVVFFLPQSYVSQSVLALPMPGQPSNSNQPTISISTVTVTPTPAQATAMVVLASPVVLDPVIQSLRLSEGEGSSVELARKALGRQIKITASKDGLLRLDVTANSPAQAQAVASAVVDSWLKSTVPSEQERAVLEGRLAHAKASLESVNRFMARLTADDVPAAQKTARTGDAGTSLVAVGELQARYLNEVLSIPRQLKGLSRDDVIKQPPTLPTEPTAPKKGLIAVLSTLAAGFVLLLWVFMRQAWRNATQDPQAAPKLARLRAALGLRQPTL